MAKELVSTPVEGHKSPKEPYRGSGESTYNGEPGLPERTGGAGVPEVTYDRAAGSLPKGEHK